MKSLGLIFSARKAGNCLSCVKYCLDKFKKQGFETEFLNAYNLKIMPCSHCNYECFARPKKECPIKDDVKMMYSKIISSNVLLFAIPDYVGHPSGLYRAWFERGCMLDWGEYEKGILLKPRGYIVIGNITAEGDQVLHEILTEFYNTSHRPEAILLQAREYERDSLKGDLIEATEVKRRLDKLVERVLKKAEIL
ncbi:flavodoxin family protein [candidate division WOR-3 bacterium]|nr:flavodoxin family protein [candidate division WOR-3 bacterium]